MGLLENLALDKELSVQRKCEGCGVQVIIDHNFVEKEGRSIVLGCLWYGLCKPCYESSLAEHPEKFAWVAEQNG